MKRKGDEDEMGWSGYLSYIHSKGLLPDTTIFSRPGMICWYACTYACIRSMYMYIYTLVRLGQCVRRWPIIGLSKPPRSKVLYSVLYKYHTTLCTERCKISSTGVPQTAVLKPFSLSVIKCRYAEGTVC